jgi:hypothetical protein
VRYRERSVWMDTGHWTAYLSPKKGGREVNRLLIDAGRLVHLGIQPHLDDCHAGSSCSIRTSITGHLSARISANQTPINLIVTEELVAVSVLPPLQRR